MNADRCIFELDPSPPFRPRSFLHHIHIRRSARHSTGSSLVDVVPFISPSSSLIFIDITFHHVISHLACP